MSSLKQSIDELEAKDALFRASLECYLSAILSVEKHALEIVPEAAGLARGRLEGLRCEVQHGPTVPILEQSSLTLDAELGAFHEKATATLAERTRELKAILEVLAEAARLLNQRNETHSAKLRGFADSLDAASRMDNLAQIRRTLNKQVTSLRECVDRLHAEKEASVAHLENERHAFQERLAAAEKMAYLDPLTGLGNRREAERVLAELARCKVPFCVILLDLNRFRWINSRYGHPAGDQVLRVFAERLRAEVRPSDAVCRWGGDEFLIVLECPLSDSMRRAYQMGPRLRGRYRVTVEDKEAVVDVSASLGVAEHVSGETPQQLFVRADAALRRQSQIDDR